MIAFAETLEDAQPGQVLLIVIGTGAGTNS
jgi:hypothetical protein